MNTGSHFRRKFKRMFSDGPSSLLSLVFLLNKHTRATKSVVWSQCSNIVTLFKEEFQTRIFKSF